MSGEEKEKYLAKCREYSRNKRKKASSRNQECSASETQSDGLENYSSLSAHGFEDDCEPNHVSSDDLSSSNGRVDIFNHFSSENELPGISSCNEYSEMVNRVNDVTSDQVASSTNEALCLPLSVRKSETRTLSPSRQPSPPDVKIKSEYDSN